jgi:hypothetical protein
MKLRMSLLKREARTWGALEQKVHVAAGRFIVEAGKPPVVEYHSKSCLCDFSNFPQTDSVYS